MSHRRLLPVALALALSACVVKPPVTPQASAAPSPKATTKAEGSARPATGLLDPAKLPLLKAPPSGTVALAGKVTIDAHYAVTDAGAKLIGLDGSTLIGNDGSTLIGNDGATAVNVAAGLIGNDGSTLIGNDGSTLIGLDGSTLVAAGGGNLIGKRKLDLQQVKDKETYQVGTLLPAAAMELTVTSLETGKPLALGVDDKGAPVFTILTNAAGAYTVYLPEAIGGSAYVVTARVPGTADERVIYQTVVPKVVKTAPVDEDTATATAYFREAFVSRLVRLSEREFSGNRSNFDLLPPQFKDSPLVNEIFDRLLAAAERARALPGETPERLRARARATADVLFAQVDFTALVEPNSGRPVLDVLTEIVRTYREAATARMRTDPDYFNGPDAPLIVAYNREQAALGQPRFVVRKPADVGDFVRASILLSADRGKQAREIPLAFDMVGYPAEQKADALKRLDGAMTTLLFAAGTPLLANPPMDDGTPTLDAAVKAMETNP